MKKIYNSPEITVVKIQQVMPLATSGVGTDSPYDIGYGGVDNDGIGVPEVRQINGAWEDEW